VAAINTVVAEEVVFLLVVHHLAVHLAVDLDKVKNVEFVLHFFIIYDRIFT
jgi:hypothetical protein